MISELYMTGARRNGRSWWLRQQTEAAALLDEHVHFLARDGQWCVTWQPAGFFLWARMPHGWKPGQQRFSGAASVPGDGKESPDIQD
jgi:hypothetical protein